MVMQSISLHDMLSIETGTDGGIELRSNAKDIPCDERNLVFKAIRAFYDACGIMACGVSVAIEKRIPVMAGLAGGSTDAAAVIRALDYIHNTRFTEKELQAIGLTVGRTFRSAYPAAPCWRAALASCSLRSRPCRTVRFCL